jgi:hypothetical protein
LARHWHQGEPHKSVAVPRRRNAWSCSEEPDNNKVVCTRKSALTLGGGLSVA